MERSHLLLLLCVSCWNIYHLPVTSFFFCLFMVLQGPLKTEWLFHLYKFNRPIRVLCQSEFVRILLVLSSLNYGVRCQRAERSWELTQSSEQMSENCSLTVIINPQKCHLSFRFFSYLSLGKKSPHSVCPLILLIPCSCMTVLWCETWESKRQSDQVLLKRGHDQRLTAHVSALSALKHLQADWIELDCF